MNKEQILSCIQPTGQLHFGNYFGAIQNWVQLQKDYDCIYGIVDYHAMTMPYKAKDLLENTLNMAKDLVACGVNSSNLFIQSHIPEHTELSWILSCVTAHGELNKQTQFKDKSKKQDALNFVSAGLFTYPVLQAADILIYHADKVPVGKDQEQHLELSRNVANRFNHLFNVNYFKEPKALFTKIPKVMSLAKPSSKMSKSLGGKHYVGLFESPDSIRKKVRSAVTDSGEKETHSMSPGINNLLSILKASDKQSLAYQFEEDFEKGVLKYSSLKNAVADALIALTTPFIKHRIELDSNTNFIREEIRESSFRHRAKARKTLNEIREIVGLQP